MTSSRRLFHLRPKRFQLGRPSSFAFARYLLTRKCQKSFKMFLFLAKITKWSFHMQRRDHFLCTKLVRIIKHFLSEKENEFKSVLKLSRYNKSISKINPLISVAILSVLSFLRWKEVLKRFLLIFEFRSSTRLSSD